MRGDFTSGSCLACVEFMCNTLCAAVFVGLCLVFTCFCDLSNGKLIRTIPQPASCRPAVGTEFCEIGDPICTPRGATENEACNSLYGVHVHLFRGHEVPGMRSNTYMQKKRRLNCVILRAMREPPKSI